MLGVDGCRQSTSGDRERTVATDDRARVRRSQQRALTLALAANVVLFAGELVGGLVFRSLALLADAAHVLSDVGALAIALAAQRLTERPATHTHSFGLQRAEVLGAQANGFILLAVSGWVIAEAVRRIGTPVEVRGAGLLTLATVGLVVNLVAAAGIARVQGESLNLRGALFHLVADALGSVAAVVAGVAVLVADADFMDPVASLAVAVLVIWSASRLLRETTHVLLEGTPRGLDLDEVERALTDHPEVEAVHHVHAWNLASDVRSLSAHVVVREDISLHAGQMLGDELKAILERRFAIQHATLELECHVCEPVDEVH